MASDPPSTPCFFVVHVPYTLPSFFYKQLGHSNVWLDYFSINSKQRIYFNKNQMSFIYSDIDRTERNSTA